MEEERRAVREIEGATRMTRVWPSSRLGDVCVRVTDGTHQSPRFESSGVPFLVISNIIGGSIDWGSVSKWVSEPTYEQNTARCRPERGDVLYTAVGSFGVAVPVESDQPFMFQRHIAHIKPAPDRLETRFLTHVLNSPALRATAERVAKGVAQRTVTLGDLKDFRIPLPPLPEQRRIADILDKADAIRRKRREAIALTEELLRSTFLDMFGDPVTNPKGWATVRIEELASSDRNALAIGPFGSNLLAADYASAGHPVIFVRDLVTERFAWKSRVYVSHEKFIELAAHRAHPGDVLTTKMGNPPGNACVVPADFPPAIITADVVKVAVDRRRVLPEYLAAAINSPLGRQQILRISAGITRAKITLRDFRSVHVLLPPLAEQKIFDDFAGRVRRLRSRLVTGAEDGETFFGAIVQRAFSGHL